MFSASTDSTTTPNTTMHDLQEIQKLTAALQMTQAHEVIDHCVTELEANIRSLRSLRNRKTHILSLPAEILGSILTAAVEPASYQVISWGTHVKLTSVCSLWREVALHCPSFWACMPISQCKHLADMLARSKSYPLSIRIDEYRNNYPGPRHTILSQAGLALVFQPHRIRELHLKANPQVMQRYIVAIPEDIPEVQSLVLESAVSRIRDHSFAKETALPLHIFTIPKPALRHLELSRCAVDWKAIDAPGLPISNLLSLSLKSLDPRIPHHFLLGILATSPRLKIVDVQFAIADGTKPISEDKQNLISLSHMREYTITDAFATILNHRTHLTLPSAAKINFTAPSVSSDSKGASTCAIRLLSVFGLTSPSTSMNLEACYQTHSEREFEFLYINFDYQAITLCLFETRAADSELFVQQENHTPDIRLQIPNLTVNQKTVTLFQVLRVLGVKQVRVDMYETSNQVSALSWRAFVGAHPGISSLYMCGQEINHFCQALSSAEPVIKPKPKVNPSTDSFADPEDLSLDCEASTGIIYATSLAPGLPSLKTFILEGVVFRMPWDSTPAHQSYNFSSLLTACIDRCNCSLPLPIISVRESVGFDNEMKTLLGEVVGMEMVKWDGRDTREIEDWEDPSDEDVHWA